VEIPFIALCELHFIMDKYSWKLELPEGLGQFKKSTSSYVEIPFIALCELHFIMDKYSWKLELPNSETPTLNFSKICRPFYTTHRNVNLCPSENQTL
jgi:hypothetical protein